MISFVLAGSTGGEGEEDVRTGAGHIYGYRIRTRSYEYYILEKRNIMAVLFVI
jgi:hypothetical protein